MCACMYVCLCVCVCVCLCVHACARCRFFFNFLNFLNVSPFGLSKVSLLSCHRIRNGILVIYTCAQTHVYLRSSPPLDINLWMEQHFSYFQGPAVKIVGTADPDSAGMWLSDTPVTVHPTQQHHIPKILILSLTLCHASFCNTWRTYKY
jgi:hypothetical protein